MRINVPYNATNYTEFCIYHRVDMDGRGAGAMVNFANTILNKNVSFLGCNYEEDFNITEILNAFPKIKNMYVVDYSLSPNDTITVLKKGINLIWCDHHQTAYDKYISDSRFKLASIEKELSHTDLIHITLSDKYSYPGKFYGYYSHQNSGAMITYLILKSVFMDTEENRIWYKNIKEVMKTISTYDTWDQSNINDWNTALKFNTIARDYDFAPFSTKWFEITRNLTNFYDLIKEGSAIVKHDENINKINAHAYGGTLEFEGKTFCIINDMKNSIALDSIFDPSIHDACMFFKYNPKEKGIMREVVNGTLIDKTIQGVWKIGLFCNDKLDTKAKEELDLTPIALKYGGGGHRCACGFTCVDLPFNLHDIKPIYKRNH